LYIFLDIHDGNKKNIEDNSLVAWSWLGL